MTAGRQLADFEGIWSMERRITHGDGTQARLIGQARWTRAADALDLCESGMLEVEGQPALEAERRYRWAPGMRVYFSDGRFFHAVPPEGGTVSHWCDPDTYEGIYDFSVWPSFEVSWMVSGPSKDYHMHTIYRRNGS